MSEFLQDTFAGCLDAAAAAAPDREALVIGRARLTFGGLADRSMCMAAAWQELGVGRGDRVGLWLENSPQWAVAFWALARIGAIVVPLNTRWTDEEMRGVLAQAQLRAILVGDRFRKIDFPARIGSILAATDGTAPTVISTSSRPLPGIVGVSSVASRSVDAAARKRVASAQAAVAGSDIGIIQFTSGSTAFPKGAMLRQAAMLEYVRDYGPRLGMAPSDRVLCHMPFFHIAGINHVLLVPVVQGATVVTAEGFDPVVALGHLSAEHCTTFGGVATMCFVLTEQAASEAERLFAGIEKAWVLGTPNACRKIHALTGLRNMVSLYGATELSGSTTFGDIRDPLHVRLANAGRALPGIETRIVDVETGAPAAPGVTGEIWHRGRRMMAGYFGLGRSEWNIDDEGWFHTGDLGAFDAEGYLTFSGRQKEMLKVGGENVSCLEVEDALMSHPAVKLAAAVGINDERLEEVPVAFVELRAGATAGAEQLIEHAARHLSSFKVPRRVFLVREWPMTASNKIQKNVLRSRAMDAVGLGADVLSHCRLPHEREGATA